MREHFGFLDDGTEVERITFGNGRLQVTALSYGAALQRVVFDGVDLILGYDDLAGYVGGQSYQGACIGRVANRIRGGTFVLDGVTYDVGCNEDGNHLHGGFLGFDKKVWTVEGADEASVRFTLTSPDGDEGYPGTLRARVTYIIVDETLRIIYDAVSDKDTVVNLTNHAYFNLGGDISAIEMQIFADAITDLDGHILPVEGTRFDFRNPRAIRGDYDHNFVLGMDRTFRKAAVAFSPASGIGIEVATDLPGVQFYTAKQLPEPLPQAFCLETQYFPNFPNQPHYPSCRLAAHKKWQSMTEYRFYT